MRAVARRRTLAGAWTLLCLFVLRFASAQEPAERTLRLGPAIAQLSTEFTEILSITELADGRVLIADRREGTISVADLQSGQVTQVGRYGQGPGEYTSVSAIYSLGGDSSLMANLQSRRWLVFRGAMIARTLPPSAPAILATQGLVLGADASGMLLSKVSPTWERPPGPTDSVALLLVTARTGAADTVGKLGPTATRIEADFKGTDRPQSIQITTPVLAVDEQALLFPDGWLAIARLRPYRVDWRSPEGRWIRGAPIPFREIRIDDREKQAYRNRRTAVGLRSPPDIAVWAATVPPFLPTLH
ncbi:MAG: hypothetical protein ACRENP_00695 [Longimicrobiales bacterium]